MIFLILIFYILLPLFFSGLYFIGYLYSFSELLDLYNLSILTGAAAYIVFMSQFLLSARLRFLEHRISQDRLLALHGSAGLVSLLLVLIHFFIKLTMLIRFEGLSLQTVMGSFVMLIFLILSPPAILVLRGMGLKNGTSPPYARVKVGHNLFALAGLVLIFHVLLASSTWSVVLKVFTIAWGGGSLLAYCWHKILRPRRALRLEVVDYTEITPGIHQYIFGGDIVRKSGQFGYFSFLDDKIGQEEHPFTISSQAGEAVNITVRSIGDFTTSLSTVTKGTIALFDGPYGSFNPLRYPKGTELIFLTGGIGITPVLSLARDESLRSSYAMTILWSIKSPGEAVLASDLKALDHKGELSLHIQFSKKDGRIDADLLERVLPQVFRKRSSAVWFLCGPGSFIKSMNSLLRERGIPRTHIKKEHFSW